MNKKTKKNKKTFVIAEAGVNHNGDERLAYQLIDAAIAANADAVKFQTFKANRLVTETAPKANYQKITTGTQESQFEMLKRLELSFETYKKLQHYCIQHKILFLSTAFDLESLEFLNSELNLSQFKISSGDITNGPLLMQYAMTGKPLILSTGMSTLGEIEQALSVIAYGLIDGSAPSISAFKAAFLSKEGQEALQGKVSLLHCTSQYPAPYEEVNLRAMDTMRHAFNLPVGYSDHTEGIAVPIAAVARGADLIEKHFTLDRSLPGPDHKASLEPAQLQAMIQSIRQIEMAIGQGNKMPTQSELDTLVVARKSLVVGEKMRAGEKFNEQNLAVMRPGTGISPMYYWECIGQQVMRDFSQGELIE